jgi:3-hydroxyacyl-CoA dehydrogenase
MAEIKTVGVIGGGVMGSGIAQALAVGGCRVTVRDLNEQLIEKSKHTITEGRYGLERGVERGKTTREDADAALSRLSWTTSVNDLKDVDLVVEAVPEDLELKKKCSWS